MPRGSLCSKLNEHKAGRLIKNSGSKQIIHILIFVSRSWGRARERAGLELANGAEEQEDRRGGRHRRRAQTFAEQEKAHPQDSGERNSAMLTAEV